MARIAIIGPGAVGGTLAAWLDTDEEHELMFGARTPFPELVVETPRGDTLRSVPTFLEIGAMRESIDWILFATKTYDAESAARWIPVLANSDTKIAVLQNGIDHLRHFAGLAKEEVLLPVVVLCPSERSAPGVIRQRRDARLGVPAGKLGEEFCALFANTEISVELSENFEMVVWRKLCLNAPSVVMALTLKPTGVVAVPKVAAVMEGILRECIQVANAVGIGFDEDELAAEIMELYRKADPDGVNSLHADRLEGRPMEIDARNGVICRLGRELGVPTPLNDMAVAILENVD